MSEWELTEDGVNYHTVIPANTSATLDITNMGGTRVRTADGETLESNADGTYELCSGEYELVIDVICP